MPCTSQYTNMFYVLSLPPHSSWFLKGRNGKEEFVNGPRIRDSFYFDIDDIATSLPSNLPHMMPPKQLFSAAMDSCNVSNTDHIIVYGSKDCISYAELCPDNKLKLLPSYDFLTSY